MKLKLLLPVLVSLVLIGCKPMEQVTTTTTEPSDSSDTSITLVDPPSFEGDGICIHYNRKDKKYDDWALWLWEDGFEGSEYTFNGMDEFGAMACYPLSAWSENVTTNNLGFIVKTLGSWNGKDVDSDRFIEFEDLTKDDEGIYHVYLLSGDANVYLNENLIILEKIKRSQFYKTDKFIIQANANMTNIKVLEDENVIFEQDITPNKSFEGTIEHNAQFEKFYQAEVTFESGKKIITPISTNILFKTEEFAKQYNYDGELGAIVNKSTNTTTFKVWSPLSSKIVLNVYESGTPLSLKEHDKTATDTPIISSEMIKKDKGVFEITIDQNLSGKYYTYSVTNNQFKDEEIVDPYAKSAGVNGLRGMIVDFEQTNPEGWENITPHQIDPLSLTVYETHVADITSSKTWSKNPDDLQYAKLFKGAYLSNTTYEENGVTVKTGFDHIKELGVNAVQLIPIFDQANDEINMTFNWGYNPHNYNVLEGGYSTNPYDGYVRIKEFKELVQAYNEAGIIIIMDVVYNHTADLRGSNFNVLMPGYYYRYTVDDKASNGSGCGNETASDMYMFRKFMIDSTEFWTKEYKLGGFRFDLMGLHDIETMNEISANLKTINPSIAIYGEPWTGGTSALPSSEASTQANAYKYVGYGQFNDQMRDALIKGGLSNKADLGWITNNKSTISATDVLNIENGIKGITGNFSPATDDPNKTVNYVTCHDNYTLYDRIEAAGITDEDAKQKMAMLANSVVFTSQGTTFMLAGEEFLRTKNGDSNSYASSYEVNELDYSLKVKHIDMFNNYQKLLSFKQDMEFMHQNKTTNKNIDVQMNESKNQIVINFTTANKAYTIIHTNGLDGVSKTYDLQGYELYLNTLNDGLTLTSATSLNPYQTIIAYKNL